MFQVTLTDQSGQAQIKELSRKFRTQTNAKALRKEFTTGLKSAATPLMLETKAAALALPSHGHSHTGLRKRTARAISLQVKAAGKNPSVKIRISRRSMGDQAALPMLMNHGWWRHPVFNDREVWVRQVGSRDWFDRPIRRGQRKVRAEILQVMQRLERKLTIR